MKNNQSESDWGTLIHVNATRLSKAMELRFHNRLQSTVRKVLGKEELTEEQVAVRTQEILNTFFDSFVGTVVATIAKLSNSSEVIEERVVTNVRRWFAAIREMEKEDANH